MGKGAKVKGYLKNVSTGKIKKFLYNPEQINVKRSVGYAVLNAPGCSYPKYQYLDGGQKTISFDLFLYGEKGEVKKYVDFLEEFTPPENSKSRFKKPPLALFAFGDLTEKCILLDLDVGYEQFRTIKNKLVPVRASVKLNLVVVK